MLANPWTPASPKIPQSPRRHDVGALRSSRLFGVLTSALTLLTALAVMEPVQPVQASVGVAPALVELALPSTIDPARSDPAPASSSTRPTLSESERAGNESEMLALADRSASIAPAISPAESSSTSSTAIAASSEVTVGAVDLAGFALDIGDVASRAEASDEALIVEPIPDDPWECQERGVEMPLVDVNGAWDRNLIAEMTYTMFECVTSVAGFADVVPTSDGWDAAGIWGFESLAQQVAAEAVVVGYCESQAFAGFALTSNNPWGYGGVFQMGATEMRRYGFSGASKFDPVDNVYSAATYFVAMNRRGAGWGGWGPWAVVNTGYNDEVNDRVKVPVLPRFTSTDPDYRGRRGTELPAWAVDPWSYSVPAFNGCPTTGGRWQEATLIGTEER